MKDALIAVTLFPLVIAFVALIAPWFIVLFDRVFGYYAEWVFDKFMRNR